MLLYLLGGFSTSPIGKLPSGAMPTNPVSAGSFLSERSDAISRSVSLINFGLIG